MRSFVRSNRSKAGAMLTIVLLLCIPVVGLAVEGVEPSRRQDTTVWVPGELLVKFKADVAASLHEQMRETLPIAEIRLTDTLDRLNTAYQVKQITPVFKDFADIRERFETLRLKDPAKLTRTEQRLLKRRRRAPPNAPVPPLERIFKLELVAGPSVEAAVDDFRKDPDVEYAEPNYIFTVDVFPNDPYFADQWALHNVGQAYLVPGGTDSGTPDSDIDAPEAWDVYAPTQDVIVAIVDSGVGYLHPELLPKIWTDGNGNVGHDYANDDGYPLDDFGHGTLCAGIVGAVFDNEMGVSGLCPNAIIMAVKFLDDTGRAPADLAAQAIYYAVNNGAEVISNSYGYSTPSETLQGAVDYAYSQGAIMVAAAGNDDNHVPRYPASYDHVVAVAATDSDDVKASFSNYGSWVDMAAPGVDILSLRASGTDMYGDQQHIVGTDYYIASGTSMACPHVAAAVAMLISHFPDLPYEEIIARLVGTTDAIVDQNPSLAHWLGTGRMNVARALTDPVHPAIVYANHEVLDDDNNNGHLEPGESAVLRVVLKNLWADAANVNAILDTADSYLTILDGVSQYGSIPRGQEGSNPNDVFEVSLSEYAPREHSPAVTLHVTAEGPYERLLSFAIAKAIPLQSGDWPKPYGGPIQPVPYDVDGDGIVELLSVYGSAVQVIKPDGSVTAEAGSCERLLGFVAAGDLQRDGHVEIVSTCGEQGSNNQFVSVWNSNGETVTAPFWPDSPNTGGSITLYDMDGDGVLEVMLAGRDPDTGQFALRCIRWNEDHLETDWETYFGPIPPFLGVSHLAIGDLNGGLEGDEHRPEIVFTIYAGMWWDGAMVMVFDSSGDAVGGWPQYFPAGTSHAPVLADLTGDGNLEVIINSSDAGGVEGLHVWDHAGNLLWNRSGYARAPVVADLDGDGDLEVLTQTKAYHHDGTDTGWSYPLVNPGGISVADVDGDGDMEVFIGSSGLYGFHHDGVLMAGYPLYIDAGDPDTRMTPVVADLDGDGDIEITTTDRYRAVWDLPGKYSRDIVEWGMYLHDPYRTNCYSCNINLPPVWYVPPEDRAFVRHTVNGLFVQAADPERKSVTYEVLGLPASAGHDPDGKGLRLSWRPGTGDGGQDVTFCAIDADGERVEKTIRITLVDPSADLDNDGDTDLEDYRFLWACLGGPDQEPPHGDCDPADIGNDGDVDLDDFAAFQAAFGGL